MEKVSMGRRSALIGIGGVFISLMGGATTGPRRKADFEGKASGVFPSGFLNKGVFVQGKEHKYVVYIPRDYSEEFAWPTIVFLHGAGERGNDGLKPTQVGIGRAVRLYPERFPAIIIFPQCPEGEFWDAILPAMEEMLAQTQREYHVDDRRIYLTGISMGGYGTFLWGALKANIFAALMPICGGGRLEDLTKSGRFKAKDVFGGFEDRIKNLATVPIWAFHGADDSVVPAGRSQEMVKLLKAAGGDVQYTEFPGVDHNSWDPAYDMKKATDWLLKQKKK